MASQEHILAIVPARKGSKGVPGKNIRPLNGKPLISYSLEAAKAVAAETPNFDIFVTTDDDKVISVAKNLGIDVPYRRPDTLATDTARMPDVILDVLQWRTDHGRKTDLVILLQPTSAFRTPADIRRAIELFHHSKKPVIGVSPMWMHPYECIATTEPLSEDLSEKGNTWTFLAKAPDGLGLRQQYKDRYYYLNGAMYCFAAQQFLADKKIPIGDAVPLLMDDLNSIDIDTERDFVIAEACMRAFRNTLTK